MIRSVVKSFALFSLLLPFLFAGCGGGGDGDGATGTLALSMTDSTLPGFRAIYVTVDEVSVHPASGGGWTIVANPDKTVNLLELINGVRSELGIATLATDHYTQMRLRLGDQPDGSLNILSEQHPYANYFIDDAGQVVELESPSGMQTGIKVVNGFDINENQTTELVLDFNAKESVVHAGSSGKWLVKPTVKVLNTETWAIVNGTIEDGSAAPLEGILVSAQVFDAGAADRREEVLVEAATVTDENGEFALFLEPGDYNLVATRIESAEAFGPDCAAVEIASDDVLNRDFTLASTAQVGQVAGAVEIVGASSDQHAVLSFRQDFECIDAAATEPIEVAGLNVAAGDAYSVDLPAGTYNAVGSSAGETTVAADGLTVEDETETPLDFLFD